MSNQAIDPKQAAAYLLKLRRASLSFPGFMDYYHPTLSWESFHREMQEVLDLLEKDALLSAGGNPIRNVLINMPPRHAKSFNSTINFPAYCLMRKPKRELMISAYNNDLAATFGRGTRDIVTDPRAVKAFKDFALNRETRAVDFWKTAAGGAYYAVGLNGTTTGRGANGLFVDDPYKSREEADSTTKRRKIWDFYTSGLLSRMQPDVETGQPPFQIVTHTRWHPDDMAGRIQESAEFKRGEWYHLNFQALTPKKNRIYVSRANLDPSDPRYVPSLTNEEAGAKDGKPEERFIRTGKKQGQQAGRVPVDSEIKQALWPSRFSVPWLERQKVVLGARDFEALYQQNPYIQGGNILKDKWFRRYTLDSLPDHFQAVAITLDSAFKAKTTSDYSVFSVGGITEMGDIYLLKVIRDKLEFPDLKRKAIAVNSMYRGHGLRGMWVEDAASGQSLIQELRSNTGVSVIPWRPGTTDKVARANSVTPVIEAGRVFVPEEADWLEDWLSEVSAFPSVKHDDQVDSFVMLVDVLSRMVVVGLQEFNAPLGSLVGPDGGNLMSGLSFGSTPLAADPNGWMGKGGMGAAMVGWKGWGE